jgi:hypothetical protein
MLPSPGNPAAMHRRAPNIEPGKTNFLLNSEEKKFSLKNLLHF